MVVATSDEIVWPWPGHYAHVDLRVQNGNNLHESDKLHLESSLMVVTDPDSIAEAVEFQEDPWGYNTCSLAKTLYDRARLTQVEALCKQGLAPAMLSAIVTPWIDEDTE